MIKNFDITKCVNVDGSNYYYENDSEIIYAVKTEFIPVDIKPETIRLIKKIIELTNE